MRRVTYKDGYIYKSYSRQDLLDPIEIIENRFKSKNRFSIQKITVKAAIKIINKII